MKSAPTRQRRGQWTKSNLLYWQDVVYRQVRRYNGEIKLSGFYTVRIAHRGRRTTFPLYTSNKAAAAHKAREIYNVIITNGWEAALGKFKKNVKAVCPLTVAPSTQGNSSIVSFDQLKRDFLALIVPSTTRECWLWAGEHAPRNGRPIFRGEWAYRVAHIIYKGPIPVGWDVHHKCGNSKCVNPQHLEMSSPKEHRRQHQLLNGAKLTDIQLSSRRLTL